MSVTRHLYILDTETGEESGHVDVTGMKEREIMVLLGQMQAQCGDDAVALDSGKEPLIGDIAKD